MANKSNKLFIVSSIIAVVGILAYIVGIYLSNVHIVAFSTEVAGAGIVAAFVSLLK